jgi:hypothetical protein
LGSIIEESVMGVGQRPDARVTARPDAIVGFDLLSMSLAAPLTMLKVRYAG